MVLVTTGCDNGKEQSEPESGNDSTQTDSYADWSVYNYENLKLIYPPDHLFRNDLESWMFGFSKYQTQLCNFFGIEKPTDTIVIYLYTGFMQGRGATNREDPFFVGDTLHFWPPHTLGALMTDYTLFKWTGVKTKHRFLHEGLITFFDFSGTDYHELTLNFVDQDILIPLKELIRDTTINTYHEKHQSAEAASFVSYLFDAYGAQRVGQLYKSQDDIEIAISKLLKTSVEKLEGKWLHYAEVMYERKINNLN